MDLFTMFLSILFIAALKVLKHYFSNVFNYWKKRGINGPVPLPILGTFIPLLIKPRNIIEEQRLHKYGRVYGTFEFSKPTLTIADPSLIREVAIKHFYNFQNRFNQIPGDTFLIKTMFLSKDDTWKTLRSYLSPLFTTKRMKAMFTDVDKCADDTLQYIQSINGKEVILKNTMLSFTMDVIAKCAFGVDTNGYKDPNNDFLKRAHDMAKVNTWRILLATVVPLSIQRLHKSLEFSITDIDTIHYFKNIISSIISQRKDKEIKKNDFINLILRLEELEDKEESNVDIFDEKVEKISGVIDNKKNEVKKRLTSEEILAQAFLFFLAGYETTSTLLNFTLYSLAVNQDIQEKLFNEINENLDDEKGLNYDITSCMPYLDAVINESLRMYSPIVAFNRVASDDIVLGEQRIKIEKGTIINLPFYAIHHDPQFFSEPHSFKPERFLPENKHLIEPYTFIPFGVGPRNCIGLRFALMTAKIFLIKLLQDFEVVKTRKTVIKPKYTIVYETLGCKPLIVAFKLRKS